MAPELHEVPQRLIDRIAGAPRGARLVVNGAMLDAILTAEAREDQAHD